MARTTKMKLPLKMVETATKSGGYRMRYSAMCVVVSGDEEVFFDFSDVELRDDCTITLLRALPSFDPDMRTAASGLLSKDEIDATEVARTGVE